MKFYVLTVDGATTGAHRYKRAAISEANEYSRYPVSIEMIDIDMSAPNAAEVVRRLLGQIGGFARQTKTVYARGPV